MDDGNEATEILKHKKSFDHVLGHRYTVADGLAGMQVEDIYQDRQGLLWIATADGGVSRFDGTHFDTFGLTEGLPHLTVMAIAEDADGRLLLGTLGGGLAVYDGRDFQVYTIEHGLPSNDILALQPQLNGAMRILTRKGVGWFSKGRFVESLTVIGSQPLGPVYDMATDATGMTWLATARRGVLCLDGRRMSTDFGAPNGSRRWAWKFAEDTSGYLWIAFHYIGGEAVIGRYDPQQQQFELIDVGVELEAGEVVRHGMRDVRLDERGWLWVARRGVLVYDGEEWRSFSARLPSAHFEETRLTYEDREGNIWVGLWGGGLVFCDPVSTQIYSEADGLPRQVVEGRLLASSQGVSYPEGTAEIAIYFQGIRFGIRAEPMRYSHRLVGYGLAAQWSAPTLNNKVSYKHLPVGEYRFEVRVQEREGLMSEVASLEVQVVADVLDEVPTLSIFSQSVVISQILKQVSQVAETDTGVLILGETGVGKGLLARTIHDRSTRHQQAFIPVNCGGLPVGLVESELFGHEKGAFTGAVGRHRGWFEQAHGGTLFLDEIGDLPLEAQRVLLHVLEEDRLTRLGGQALIPVDVRIIAATNRDLHRAVREGTFREDLYYRLNVFPLVLPPLRERQEDIPLLAAHFVQQYAHMLKRPVPTLSDEVMSHICRRTLGRVTCESWRIGCSGR